MTKTITKSLISGLIALGLFFGIQFAQLPIFYFLEQNKESALTSMQSLIAIGAYLTLIVITLIIGIYAKVIDLKHKLNWKYLALAIFAGEVAIFAFSLIAVIIKLIMGDAAVAANQEIANDLMQQVPMVLMVIMLILGAPIVEESIFRGFIPEMFPEKWQWVGLLIGAVLFGLIHNPTDLGSVIQYVSMGMVFALVRYFGKRIEYSIILHAIHNALVLATMISQLK
ncbi:CPBP family intramembrane glutamic endopeptidase [Streptococcus hillyeri]|uniref:CPBP family intramembrane metalloprotease n=1 Tax=Streptococcus hillyeri TaxID=2282420 RepID=A0A3L9DRT4_9STRE|nr:type II CAAX endopeptidase family protein [Streptococcus hillyeri]RLY03254.1 CPBP family intramembrane metalloprotease [Streptococcus hillyeri]